MSYLGTQDYFTEVGAGNISGHKHVAKFGKNEDVDTSEEDIWSNGGVYGTGFLTSADTVVLSSGSANDTNSAGTGARKVTIEGLDANWDFQSETMNMNGTTNVNSANTYIRVFRMYVTEAGSVGTNDDTITATASVFTLAVIKPGEGQTQMCIYTVPRNKKLLVYDIQVGVEDGQPATIKMWTRRDLDTATPAKRLAAEYFGVDGQVQFRHRPPTVIDGPADVWVAAIGGSVNTKITAQFYAIER